MHRTALQHGRLFFDTYLSDMDSPTIVDVGSLDVEGSLRSVAPTNAKFIGVDFAEGKGVDVVLDDPYTLPFDDASVDVVVSSSCYEHAEFFWLSFLEVLRVLKPSGLFYLNVPSNGWFHRYPVDCWRFYPDSGRALQNWGRRNGVEVTLLESFVGKIQLGNWNDFVAVFVKEGASGRTYEKRMLDTTDQFTNGLTDRSPEFLNFQMNAEYQTGLCWKARRFFLGTILRRLG
jgi:SAM-dependent methyltransferase